MFRLTNATTGEVVNSKNINKIKEIAYEALYNMNPEPLGGWGRFKAIHDWDGVKHLTLRNPMFPNDFFTLELI